jgi:Nif-specific regulatory protein
VACVQTVARFVSTIAARLLELRRRRSHDDATRAIRERMDASRVLGRSKAIARLLERLAVVAPMPSNALLTGPSGTGKSLLARILHDNSERAKGPFVALNCAALPESLVESELFGAERGAHSGVAQAGIPGKVAAAEGGTLFLDEIGELPLTVQAKVLQLVQTKEYFRLGASTMRKADVRIVAATNRDLGQAVAERTFREDLYYRVRSVQLRAPALSERREDIPLLAEHFLAESCQSSGVPPMTFSAAVQAAIEFADWPGNVRQLASFCEEAVVNARIDHSTVIEMRHAFPSEGVASGGEDRQTFQGARQQWERSFLSTVLAKCDWNVAQTARELEMSRSHLNALIRRYELQRGL